MGNQSEKVGQEEGLRFASRFVDWVDLGKNPKSTEPGFCVH